MTRLVFITHPEVVIDPAVPVPHWPLSDQGRARMRAFLAHPVVADIRAVACSEERKARDGAEILARHARVPILVDEELGENDGSATGYIAPPEFWQVVDAFFARPEESIRGWERAVDAQARIVRAVGRVDRGAPAGDVAIVSHGGVGCLLLAHLQGAADARRLAQPHRGGGCFFVIDRERMTLLEGWRVIDERAPAT